MAQQAAVVDRVISAPCGEVVAERPARVADPSTMVIFGATGDLAKRKLLPALYNLNAERLLPDRFAVIGVAREGMSTQEYREKVSRDLQEFATGTSERVHCEWLESRLKYLGGDFDDEALYTELRDAVSALNASGDGTCDCIFYLATAHGISLP